jgi:hypothetical protein
LRPAKAGSHRGGPERFGQSAVYLQKLVFDHTYWGNRIDRLPAAARCCVTATLA